MTILIDDARRWNRQACVLNDARFRLIRRQKIGSPWTRGCPESIMTEPFIHREKTQVNPSNLPILYI
jgi:hypothetical protein